MNDSITKSYERIIRNSYWFQGFAVVMIIWCGWGMWLAWNRPLAFWANVIAILVNIGSAAFQGRIRIKSRRNLAEWQNHLMSLPPYMMFQ